MKYNIAIIGNKDTVGGFKALGVTPYPAENALEAITHIQTIRAQTHDTESFEKYAVIFLTEGLAEHISDDEYTKLVEGPLPAILIIPDLHGSRGTAVARLKSLAERDIGSDVLG